MSNTRYVTINGKWRLTLRELQNLERLIQFAEADFSGVSDDDLAQQFGSVGNYKSAGHAIDKLRGWLRYTKEAEAVAEFNRRNGTRHTVATARALARGHARALAREGGDHG